jgi:DNA-binding transcriptional regulator YiaG
MTQPKPSETLSGQICPSCEQGRLHLVQIEKPMEEFADLTGYAPKVQVWVDRCDHCQETFYPAETVKFIEQIDADELERLLPEELATIRKALCPNGGQTEMSEILGLGSKTYHRWENGSQYPSRSMCYYLRVLEHFPEAFAWLRARGWRVSEPQPDALVHLQAEGLPWPAHFSRQREYRFLLAQALQGQSAVPLAHHPSPLSAMSDLNDRFRELAEALEAAQLKIWNVLQALELLEFAKSRSGIQEHEFSFEMPFTPPSWERRQTERAFDAWRGNPWRSTTGKNK